MTGLEVVTSVLIFVVVGLGYLLARARSEALALQLAALDARSSAIEARARARELAARAGPAAEPIAHELHRHLLDLEDALVGHQLPEQPGEPGVERHG